MPKKSLSKLFIAATRKTAKNAGAGRPPPELATPRKPVPRSVPSSSYRPKCSGESAAMPTTASPRVSSQVLSRLKQAAARNAGASLSPVFAVRIFNGSEGPHQIEISHHEDGTVIDSSDFVKWHNGGGLVHRSACIDPTVLVEIGAIVHPNSVLGVDVHIGSGAIVGPSVSIGQSTKVGYNAALCNCSVGLSCIIYNGVCIGQDGFGFFVDEEGLVLKKPQVLQVRIGNHVEIGANTCIDRGSWRETVIGDHTKIDNLVQIGHNVVIGKCCMLCGQVGVAGSVTMGDYVTLAGRVAVRDHVSIASKVRLAANSCVTKDIVEPGDYGGFPAVPIHEWRRQSANLRRLCKKPIS